MFGKVEVTSAVGAKLAHRMVTSNGPLAKGHLLSPADARLLASDGVKEVLVHRLEPDEIDESSAAELLRENFISDGIEARTGVGGRINFYASLSGLFRASQSLIDNFNLVDDAITFACLNDFSNVTAGELVGTIKIITLAVTRQAVLRARRIASKAAPICLKPFLPNSVTIISTTSGAVAAKTIAKTHRVTTDRVLARNSKIIAEFVTDHSMDALADVLRSQAMFQRESPDIIIVFGASAVADAGDVIPLAIQAAGGQIDRIGMPVDPGNLAVLGRIRETVVIGAPGCARSPAMNGLDIILDRVAAKENFSRAEIARLGVGGLLKTIDEPPRERKGRAVPNFAGRDPIFSHAD